MRSAFVSRRDRAGPAVLVARVGAGWRAGVGGCSAPSLQQGPCRGGRGTAVGGGFQQHEMPSSPGSLPSAPTQECCLRVLLFFIIVFKVDFLAVIIKMSS